MRNVVGVINVIEEGVWALFLYAAFDLKPDVSKSSPHYVCHLQSLHSANLPLTPRLYPMRVWPKAVFISRKQYSVNVMSPHKSPRPALGTSRRKDHPFVISCSHHSLGWALLSLRGGLGNDKGDRLMEGMAGRGGNC